MKALSIKQPWASLIIRGGKDIENRNWPAPQNIIGQRIAVHASKLTEKAEVREAFDLWIANGRCVQDWYDRIVPCAFGAIIGTVILADCVEQSSSPWFFGRYGFVLASPVYLSASIPVRGALGFWNLPKEIEEQIVQAVGA